jgi:uncharacterized protein YegJ (DUF2314 family)
MLKPLLTTFALLMFTMMTGCSRPSEDDTWTQRVINVEDDDPEMIAAIQTARNTFGFFESNWESMESDAYSVKFALPTHDGQLEHIWFTPTSVQGDQITGVCANDPEKIPGLKIGDTRTVTRDDLSDWMIVVGNKCFGGYTIRVLAERNPDAAPPLEYVDPPAN